MALAMYSADCLATACSSITVLQQQHQVQCQHLQVQLLLSHGCVSFCPPLPLRLLLLLLLPSLCWLN
jgi:hypothetical protein